MMRFTLILLAVPALLLAQAPSAQKLGSLSGVVYDPLGDVMPNAEVRVELAPDKVLRALTSNKGAYTLPGLPAGRYQVSVFVRGGRKFTEEAVAISVGQTRKLDVHLKDDSQLGAIGDNAFAAAIMARKPVPTGPTPRSLDGHPDLSGVWAPSQKVDPGKPEMLPWAEKIFKERIASNTRDIPTSSCLPWGPTFDVPTVFKFIQAPKTIVTLNEDAFPYRQIHLDGRAHPTDADPTWMGHSIGHWEGETLVVDTTGFNDKGWSPIPYPRTTKFHMIEHIRRLDLGHIEIETTIDDPGTYAKPWTFKVASTLLPNDEIGEYVCAENNQYAGHAR